MWLHPHVHMLVTAGGLALDGDRWRHRRTYLFPLHMMADVVRAKMLDALRLLRRQGTFSGYPDFEDPEAFDRLTTTLAKVRWIVFAKRPFRRPEHVLRYLGRYTHRVALSNSRLLDVSPTAVTLRTRGAQTATLIRWSFSAASSSTSCPTDSTRSAITACTPARTPRLAGPAPAPCSHERQHARAGHREAPTHEDPAHLARAPRDPHRP